VFKTLVCYRLIDPGGEWRLHRHWYEQSARGDRLGEDFGLVQIDKLYRCLDKLLPHKEGLFSYLRQRWQALFDVDFEVLLYDLTSTYFESDPPEEGKRRFGYSRDKHPDCVQMVIALIVTPDGFPLAYEIRVGNTSDKTTLGDFLKKIEKRYGKAQRTWVMDRGIPTEETLSQMRAAQTPIHYLVGTPRGRLSKLEKAFLELKGDLSIRPIYHQKDVRIEAHVFVAFMAYCLQVTLKRRLRALAPGLTPRAVLEKFSAIHMVDVHLPTTEGRHLILPRYTQPEPDHKILLQQLKLELPAQPPPKISSNAALAS
jgi:hypothetical protein